MSRYTPASLTPATFPLLWAQDMPLVVESLLERFEVPWTPVLRGVACERRGVLQGVWEEQQVLGCWVWCGALTPAPRRKAAGAGTEPLGPGVWKFKLAPPLYGFRKAFPELWDDFARADSVPSYMRRDGVMNLASHFPEGAVGPDIGPKMYNTMATLGAGSKSSTRLHMDMADAVNIMT
ncbi:hypothetical protein DXG01_004647, partial [Tephrocybe rancida]